MFSRQSLSSLTAGGAIIIAWIIFTTLYFLISVTYPFIVGKTQWAAIQAARVEGANLATNQALQSFSGNVFQNGYGKAVIDLATALDAQVKWGCKEAVPVNIGTGSLGIISVGCLQTAQSGSTAPAPVATPEKK